MKIDSQLHDVINNVEIPPASQDFFDNLEIDLTKVEQDKQTSKVRAVRWQYIAGPSLVAAAAAVFVLTSVLNSNPAPKQQQIAIPPTTGTSTPVTELRPILASQVIAKATGALGNVSSLTADVTFRQNPYSMTVQGNDTVPGYTASGQLMIRNDGRYLVNYTTGPNEARGPEVVGYDPSAGTAEQCWQDSKKWFCSSTTGVTPLDAQAQLPLDLGSLTALLRNAVADDSKNVTETTYESRPAWQLTAAIKTGAFYADSVTVTIDQQTGMVVDALLYAGGKEFSETKLSNVVTDKKLTDADLKLVEPKGAQVNTPDKLGAVKTTVDAVKSRAGYAPLVPTLGDDWSLQQVFFLKTDGGNSVNPESRNVVSLTYRRGLESVTFTTRSRGAGQWDSDPLFFDGDASFTKKTVKLSDGAFAGTSVTVETELASQHLWGVGKNLVLAISGDLTADEMTAAANSLQPE